jgi:hypothetical protein
MARILTKDVSNGVTETFAYDDATDTVIVRRSQDAQGAIDAVAAANVEGVRSIDGLGIPQSEVPITVAIEFCTKRGIPWEAFLYTNQYDDEWGKFLKAHPNLCYRPAVRYHAVGGVA